MISSHFEKYLTCLEVTYGLTALFISNKLFVFWPSLMLNIDLNLWEDCPYEEAIFDANHLSFQTGLTRE
jgi:hypothetical protein